MKNSDIILLVNSGLMGITTHSLDSADAYKVYKFKTKMLNLHNDIKMSEIDFLKECDIPDVDAFNKELKESIENKSEKSKELLEKLRKFNGLKFALYNDDVDTSEIKPLSYEAWKKLQDENAEVEFNDRKNDIFSGYIEYILEDILWVAPE